MKKKWSVKYSWGLRKLRFLSLHQIQARAMLGNQEIGFLLLKRPADYLLSFYVKFSATWRIFV